jgi:gliding motility-associated-like protein
MYVGGIRFYTYTNSSSSTTDTFYTYTTPGIYSITQVIYYNGNPIPTTKNNYIQILTTPDPQISVAICEGGIVKVTTDNIYDKYIIDYKDGTIDTIGPSATDIHTYTNYSTQTITVKGRYLPTWCGSADVTTTVTPIQFLKNPDFTTLVVNSQSSNGSISLLFNASPEQNYVIQQNINNTTSGGFISLDTLRKISGPQTYIINNLNTQFDTYCYRILSIDDCNPPKSSDIICSLINTVVPVNNQNNVSWTAHLAGNESSYSVIRDNSSIQTISPPTTTYSDGTVKCGVNYCYKIIADINRTVGVGSSLQSISGEQCVTAISTNIPPAVSKINSTILNGAAMVFWDTPTSSSVKTYNILRSQNGGAYSKNGNSNTPIFTDKSVSIPDNSYCYEVSYSDSCDKPSTLSASTCPVILNVSIDPSNVFKNNLTWTSYIGSWIPDDYIVQRLDENNQIISMTPVGTILSYQDLTTNNSSQFIRYRILAQRNGGTDVSFSNVVEIKYEGQVYLPTAFTPNADGSNDVFFAEGRFIKNFKMSIFSRWGEIVFISDQMTDGWNGFYNGVPATADAYAYLVQATDYWGKTITKRGSVTLIK